jgi:hypothetical protein
MPLSKSTIQGDQGLVGLIATAVFSCEPKLIMALCIHDEADTAVGYWVHG